MFQETIVYGGGGGGNYLNHSGLPGGSGGGAGWGNSNGGIKTLPTYGSTITAINSTYYGNDGVSITSGVISGNGGSANFTSDISGTNYTYSTGGDGKENNVDTTTNDDGVNYGDGGGGAGWNSDTYSGKGSDGIVIIRYKTTYNTSSYNLSQWTYNNDDSVYHMGKVGIGTANPSTELDVMGDVTGNTKNFKIIHPLDDKKWLLHGTIEAPRYENIYRGKKTIKNGKCSISIDRDCNESGGMTKGTFIALNKNYQLYLQNNNTYDKVIGEIGTDGIIRIRCENTTDEIEIDWMVIGERKDSNVVNEPITNASGSLICEHYMSGYNENNVDM